MSSGSINHFSKSSSDSRLRIQFPVDVRWIHSYMGMRIYIYLLLCDILLGLFRTQNLYRTILDSCLLCENYFRLYLKHH